MASIGSAPGPRGILQPDKKTLQAVWCEICCGFFVPDESNFGCPSCAEQRQLAPPTYRAVDRASRHARPWQEVLTTRGLELGTPAMDEKSETIAMSGRALLIKRFSRFELKELGYDE